METEVKSGNSLQPPRRGFSQERADVSGPVVVGCGRVEIHLRRMSQLFDSLDHSPFREKDLDRNAEEYIVESIKEFPPKVRCELVIYVEQPVGIEGEEKVIEEAVRVHFARREQTLKRGLQQLLRRGVISLGIGLSFLVTFFLAGQFVQQILGQTQLAMVLRESLLIGGWVAMWKPLEIFLYDWWPILGERRLNERLSKMKVKIVQVDVKPDAGTYPTGGDGLRN